MIARLYPQIVIAVRLLMGTDYLINGANWWFKMITPYPSLSDFATHAPPPDFVGGLIATGFMFHIVKATEILTGLALLTNRFVPLALVMTFPVTVSVFLADVFLIATVRGFVMGGGALLMNSFLILACLSHYRPMLRMRAQPDALDGTPAAHHPETTVRFAQMRMLALPALGVLALLAGLVMVTWVAVMMAQYAANPRPFGH